MTLTVESLNITMPTIMGRKHTKRNKGPWTCVYTEVYMTRSEAMKREKEIKGKKSRKYIEYLLSRQSPESVRD